MLIFREEEPAGDWKLHIIDWKNPQFTGKFTNWTITLWGEMVEEPEDGGIIHVPMVEQTFPTKINTETDESEDKHVLETVTAAIVQPIIVPSVLEQQPTAVEPVPSTPSSVINSDTPITYDENNNGSKNSDDNDHHQENNGINILPDASTQLDNLTQDEKLINNERGSSSSVIIIFMIIVSMIIFSWFLRRRIKGLRPAKDMTAYSTLDQHHFDSNPFEFESFDHHHNKRSHNHLSDSNSEISDDINHSHSTNSFDGANANDDDFNTNMMEPSSLK